MARTIKIDVERVAALMHSKGIKLGDLSGWSNTLLDVLESEYDLEGWVRREMEQLELNEEIVRRFS